MPEDKYTSSDFPVPLFACYFELSFCHLELKGSRLRQSMWRVVEYKMPLLPSPSDIAFPDIQQIPGYCMTSWVEVSESEALYFIKRIVSVIIKLR